MTYHATTDASMAHYGELQYATIEGPGVRICVRVCSDYDVGEITHALCAAYREGASARGGEA